MGRSLSQLPNRLSTFNADDRFYVVRGTSNYYTTYADLASVFGGGGGGVPTEITVANSTDTTGFLAFFDDATGNLGPKTNTAFTINGTTGALGATTLILTTQFGGSTTITSTPLSSGEFSIYVAEDAFSLGSGTSAMSLSSAGELSINNKNLTLGGNVSFGTAFSTSAFTFTTNGVTYTLPSSTATLATVAGTLALTGGTMTGNITFGDTGEGLSLHGGGTLTGASGAITATASGTNQNITLTPSGTGVVTLGQVVATSANYPPFSFERTTTNNTVLTSMRLLATLATDMSDGFGPVYEFAIRDNAAVSNPIAYIGAVRSGADNSGALIVSTYSAGTAGERMRIFPTGGVSIGNTTNPGATNLSVTGTVTIGSTLGVTGATTCTGLLAANGGITLGDAQNIAVNTTTGTKIGTATTQKIGFFNATPVVQGASVADATGGVIIDAEARTAINAIISRLEALGLIATV